MSDKKQINHFQGEISEIITNSKLLRDKVKHIRNLASQDSATKLFKEIRNVTPDNKWCAKYR